MNKLLKSIVLMMSFALISTCYAQNDSTTSYDLVYLTKGGVLKGEILSFDEVSGSMVFKDVVGRKYSLAREDYKYYVENYVFPVRRKKKFELRDRKENETEFSAGLSFHYLNYVNDFRSDEHYISGNDAVGDIPLSLKLSYGKYHSRRHYYGVNVDMGLLSYHKNRLGLGVRYAYHYDGYKSNTAYYLPVELNYFRSRFSDDYSVNDTLFDGNGGYEYPRVSSVETYLSGFNFQLGQGIAFIGKEKRSIALEIALIKQLVSFQRFDSEHSWDPNTAYSAVGGRFSLLYNF